MALCANCMNAVLVDGMLCSKCIQDQEAARMRAMRASVASILPALPPKQRLAVMFLRDVEGGWATQDAIGEAIQSSYRGTGNVLNRLLDRKLVTIRFGTTRQEWGLRARVRSDAA